jgi:hypothetical protein
MSDSVTDKTKGFPSEHNRVKAAAASIDVARGACERIGVAS